MARAQATMEVFAHFCSASGIEPGDVLAVATSAIRDASNSAAFLERAQAASGLRVRVLSGEEEARYGYLAAVNSTTLADGVMLDIGGGSMQLVHVVGPPFARARLLAPGRGAHERALPARRRPGQAQAGPRARAATSRPSSSARRGWSAAARGWSASAGRSATSRRPPSATSRCPRPGVQGYVDHARGARPPGRGARRRARPAERAKFPGIKPSRGDIILGGAIVVQTVMEVGGFEGLEVTEAGLREGVFFEHHLGGDPPLFDDVRRASVVNLAAQYEMDPERNPHVAHVAQLALGLFDELAAAGRARRRPGRARAAVGRGAAARHRHDRRLRRPPQALALPRPQRRPARLRAARARAHRPGGALPPQGHAVAGAVRPAGGQGRRGAPEPHVGAACGWPRTSSARATSSCARPTSPSTTARCASSSTPTATTASRAGPPGARSSSSRAPSTVS